MSSLTRLPRTLLALLALVFGTQAFAARTTTYLHNDGLGSVVAATNEAGQVLWRKDYAPFGQQIDPTPDTERLSYTGKSHDADLGLTYFGARYFDPEIGRFMSPDPVGFVEDNPMSFNRYLYVNNNPYKYVDPDGEFLNFAVKFVLDVGINVAFNYVTTGKLNVGGALKESAIGVLNPAKTLAKGKQLSAAIAKGNRSPTCRIACFVAGTLVLTDRGYQPIETLEVGQLVWAHNPETGETALKPILNTIVNTKDTVWKLVLEKEGLRYVHEVTGSHPYFVVDDLGRGTWVEVAQLKQGEWVQTLDGHQARIVSLHDTKVVHVTYNVEVADINTYHVGLANVLVHNMDCGGDKIPPYARNKYKSLTETERAAVKKKDPNCVYCETKPTTTVDHVRSQKQDWLEGGWKDSRDVRSQRINDSSNLRGACESCNPSKGSRELGTQWIPPKDR
jgi:RHS repeat-associated protein